MASSQDEKVATHNDEQIQIFPVEAHEPVTILKKAWLMVDGCWLALFSLLLVEPMMLATMGDKRYAGR
jgi:hypothetical protein